MCKITLATGTIVGYAYGMEFFIAWYGANPNEGFAFVNRAFGHYAWAYWIMISCNVITPQFIWFKSIRRSPLALFILSIFVNIGMWFERFVITVTSLHRDALPSSWDYFVPVTEVLFLLGTFGLFFFLFLLFVRFFPVIAMSEVKGVMPQANPHWEGYGHIAHGSADEKSHGHSDAPAIGGAIPSTAVATTGGHS
jgi:molybdopterin-containing oxidoreductase family membrane subunit